MEVKVEVEQHQDTRRSLHESVCAEPIELPRFYPQVLEPRKYDIMLYSLHTRIKRLLCWSILLYHYYHIIKEFVF